MRLAIEMAVIEIEDEITAVAAGKDRAKFHGMLRLNESAAEIIRLLAEDITLKELFDAICEKYPDSDREEVGNMLGNFLNRLNKEGLLIDDDDDLV